MASEDNNQGAHPADDRRPRRLRRELILLAAALAIGTLVVPFLIHAVGVRVFGPIDETATLGGFYARYFSGLAEGNKIVWLIGLAPYLLVMWMRLLRLPLRKKTV